MRQAKHLLVVVAIIFSMAVFWLGVGWLLHPIGHSALTQEEQDDIDRLGEAFGRSR